MALALAAGQLGTWELDLASGTMSCSAQCKANYGRAPADRFDYPDLLATVHPDDRPAMQAAVRRALDARTEYAAEYRVRWPDETEHWVAARGRAVYDAQGTPVRMHGITQDVTERKQTEAALRRASAAAEQARASAEAANRAKSAFLATMSHEFRTPLNAMLGYTQLLELELGGPVTDQQRQYLTRLDASSRHLLTLVNDVLDLSKVDAGQLAVERESASTDGVVTEALALVRPQADAKGVRLHGATAGGGVGYVGDEDRVRQILVNLLSNAVKFTPAGGTVTVAAGEVGTTPAAAGLYGEGPWAFVEVADTGPGIAPVHHTAVFEAFRQLSPAERGEPASATERERLQNAYTRPASGAGLGLAISRRLARLMGGDLTVASALGAGATFTLWLPSARTSDGETETAAARADRADRDLVELRAPGLGDLGEMLREMVDPILAAYVDRLQADPHIPRARTMRQAQLEDHAVSLLVDFAQSLVIIGEAGDEAAALMRDGGAIQRVVAERHGERRHAQGWSEDAVRRDYEILGEEVERAVREGRQTRADAAEAAAALEVLTRLMRESAAIGLHAWQQADRRMNERPEPRPHAARGA